MQIRKDFWEVLFARRSVRRYEDRPVPEELVEKILQAASAAPSAHNAQPWHFLVISSRELRRRLPEAMAETYVQDMQEQGISSGAIQKKAQRSVRILSNAPVLVVVFLVPDRLKETGGTFLTEERIMAVQGVALACGQLMLAAVACGLSTCWFSAPLFCRHEIIAHLDVARTWEPQALITLGYPAEYPMPKQRRPLDEIRSYC